MLQRTTVPLLYGPLFSLSLHTLLSLVSIQQSVGHVQLLTLEKLHEADRLLNVVKEGLPEWIMSPSTNFVDAD